MIKVEPSQGKYNGSMRRSYLSYDAVNMKVNRMDEDRNSSGSARYRDIYLFNEVRFVDSFSLFSGLTDKAKMLKLNKILITIVLS